jgi:DNA-binding IclR family transcriptional regulator
MPQQVWMFLQTTDESWAVRWLARRLDMPESTVRGQLERLVAAGKVERHGGHRPLYRRVA